MHSIKLCVLLSATTFTLEPKYLSQLDLLFQDARATSLEKICEFVLEPLQKQTAFGLFNHSFFTFWPPSLVSIFVPCILGQRQMHYMRTMFITLRKHDLSCQLKDDDDDDKMTLLRVFYYWTGVRRENTVQVFLCVLILCCREGLLKIWQVHCRPKVLSNCTHIVPLKLTGLVQIRQLSPTLFLVEGNIIYLHSLSCNKHLLLLPWLWEDG